MRKVNTYYYLTEQETEIDYFYTFIHILDLNITKLYIIVH